MADISITAANVIPGSNAKFVDVTAGGTITAGIPCYYASDGDYEACDATATATNKPRGIAVNGASDGQPLRLQTSGNIDLGATLAIGTTYVVSATTGKICPEADIASTEFVAILGIADAADNLKMGILYTEVAHA